MAGRYDEAQAAYDHAITQIQSLVAADTGRPWDAVQVELTKESLLVRETALELRRIQLQVPLLIALARKNDAPAPSDAVLSRPQHIDHGAAERRRRQNPPTTFVQPVLPQRTSQWDEGAARNQNSDRRAHPVSGTSGTERFATLDANAVDDPSVWSPPPQVDRSGANRPRQHDVSVPPWARQVPAQQLRRGPSAQRGAGPRELRLGVGRGGHWEEAAAANSQAPAPAPETDRCRRRPSNSNGDKAWRNGMKPRDGRDGRAAGGGIRTGAGGGRKHRGGQPERRLQQYTPLAGDAELAEIIERDVLNRNPVRVITFPNCLACVLLMFSR